LSVAVKIARRIISAKNRSRAERQETPVTRHKVGLLKWQKLPQYQVLRSWLRCQDSIKGFCFYLLFVVALWWGGFGPVLAAADDPVLQRLEDLSFRLEKAEASRLATDQKLVALKRCLEEAVKVPSGSAQALKDKALRLLLSARVGLLSRLCVVGDLNCRIDGIGAGLSDLRKDHEAISLGIVNLLSELALNSEQQTQELASRLNACVK
jgi:hypothetical protein